jgi:methyltransferase (TIGR00027 family)
MQDSIFLCADDTMENRINSHCFVTALGEQLLQKRWVSGIPPISVCHRLLLLPCGIVSSAILFLAKSFFIGSVIFKLCCGSRKNTVRNGVSITSLLTAKQRCIGHTLSFCQDSLAHHFCPFFTPLYGRILSCYRKVFVRASDGRGLLQEGYLCSRTQFLDTVCENAQPEQLVILGAGMDTRSYRLQLPENCRCFEVDAPFTQQHKRRVVSSRPSEFQPTGASVNYVPVNFETEDLLVQLEGAGFDRANPNTLFVLEGVTYYLSKEDVMATLNKVTSCAPGSLIAFDFAVDLWTAVMPPRGGPPAPPASAHSASIQLFTSFLRRIGEPFRFGIPPHSSPAEEFGMPSVSQSPNLPALNYRKLELQVWLKPESWQRRYLNISDDRCLMGKYHNAVMNMCVMQVAAC